LRSKRKEKKKGGKKKRGSPASFTYPPTRQGGRTREEGGKRTFSLTNILPYPSDRPHAVTLRIYPCACSDRIEKKRGPPHLFTFPTAAGPRSSQGKRNEKKEGRREKNRAAWTPITTSTTWRGCSACPRLPARRGKRERDCSAFPANPMPASPTA